MHITTLTREQQVASLPDLVALLIDAVDHGASVGFLPPLHPDEARAYWQKVIAEAEQRVVIAALDGARVIGVVQLALESRANGNHRAEVQKLLVHTAYRRQGIARQLMEAVDRAALAAGRSLLVLDVRAGDAAEQLYRQVGYVQSGIIPHYARNGDGGLDDTVFYYRELPGAGT